MAWTFGDITVKDEGGAGLFGMKDVTAALQAGVSVSDIKKKIEESDVKRAEQGITGAENLASNLQSAFDQAASGTVGTSMGHSDEFTGAADLAIYHQAQGTNAQNMGQHAQQVVQQANWNPQYSTNLSHGLGQAVAGYSALAAGQDAKDLAKTAADTAADDAAKANQWRIDEAAKTKKYYEDMIKAQREATAAAAEKQRIENLKVKNTAPSQVGLGYQQLGIGTARSGAFRSGAASRGTAQLARTGKGSEVKTLNIA